MSSYVRYIDKTREYYLAQGYETPYRWAHFDEVPFTPLKKTFIGMLHHYRLYQRCGVEVRAK